MSFNKFISVFKEQDLGLFVHSHYKSFIRRVPTLTKTNQFR